MYNIPAEHDSDVDVITVEYVHEIYGGPAGRRGGSCVTVAASAAAVTSGSGADGGLGRGEKLPVEVDAAGAGLHVKEVARAGASGSTLVANPGQHRLQKVVRIVVQKPFLKKVVIYLRKIVLLRHFYILLVVMFKQKFHWPGQTLCTKFTMFSRCFFSIFFQKRSLLRNLLHIKFVCHKQCNFKMLT